MASSRFIKVNTSGRQGHQIYLNVLFIVTIEESGDSYDLDTQGGDDVFHSYDVLKDSPEGRIVADLLLSES